MKLHTDIDCRVQIRAVLADDGTYDVKATASAEYATGAKASALLTIPEAQLSALRTALMDALDAAAKHAAPRIMDAVSLSRKIARERGEIS